MSAHKPCTEYEIATIKQLYADIPAAQIAWLLKRTVSMVYANARRLGLAKSAAFLAGPTSGRIRPGEHRAGCEVGQFKPGQASWSLGTKGLVGTQPGCRATQFKKGGKPANWQPVGSYRINSYGVLDQKINDLPGASNLRWKPVTRLVWEAANGPIPKGMCVCFKPGRRSTDPASITPDALVLLTRREKALVEGICAMPPELANLHRLRGQLTRAINDSARAATAREF